MVKFALRLPDEVMEAAKQCAQADHRSLNSWIEESIRKAAEKSLLAIKPFVNVKVQPGQDIIVQQRNKAGRFTKKA